MAGKRADRDGNADIPSLKKPRYGPSKGSILKIKVHNFMTYADAEITPGPSLNLVLGPNGTGKSSLVNAICLGLAGATQLLGRADNVRDFVRRGETEGYVQIWLSSGTPGQSVCIKRSLKAKENHSEWRINGLPVNLREVKEKVKALQVQLDNLCQFLPQDKVVEFAKLKPGQLLEETEKAIGDSSLFYMHQDLIDKRNQLKSVESAARASKDELEALQKVNEGLKRDVHRFEQKEALEKQVGDLEDKLVWTIYKVFKEHHQANKGDAMLHREKYNKMQTKQQEQVKPKEDKDAKHEAAVKASKAAFAKLKKLESNIEEAVKKLSDLLEEVEDQQGKLGSLDENYEKLQTEIAKHQADIDKYKNELAELAHEQSQTQAVDHKEEIAELTLQRRDAVANASALKSIVDEKKLVQEATHQELISYHEQMRHLANVKVQKLRQLESSNRGITGLTKWLESAEAKEKFSGKVYGPILCEVTVESAQHAAFLEQSCPRDLWLRFVTENREDQDSLAKEALSRFNYRPIITNFNGNVNEVIKHNFGEASTFASFGVTHTLDEVFKAPHTVKLVMCNEADLNNTYCGDSTTNPDQFLAQHKRIRRLLTPDSVYIVRTSQYNPNARTMSVSGTRQAQLLAVGPSRNTDDERAALQAKIAVAREKESTILAELHEVEMEVKDEEGKREQIDAEIRRLQNEVNALRSRKAKIQGNLKAKEKQLKKAREKPDPRDQAPAFRARIEELNKSMCELISDLTDWHRNLVPQHQKHLVAESVKCELNLQVKAMEKENKDRIARMAHFERLMNDLEGRLEDEKRKLNKLKKDATDRTGPMNEGIKAKFAQLPSSKDAIEDRIQDVRAEIDAIQLANPRAMQEFNQRKQEITKLASAYQEQQEDLDVRKQEIEGIKGEWLPHLKRIIAEINDKFGRSFERIGCAGEVRLHEDIDPLTQQEDFEQYAIHIMVRFRAEEGLQLLTAHRQSGGERSVSTILYLIAIQDVTVCPFRVVDEINQGMDPINERKVFMQLVEAACKPNTPQCFLLTPKLLPNLPFSEHVTVLEIYNGALVSDVARGFQPADILGGRRPITV